MTENDNTARNSQQESVEEAAQEGPLPGVDNLDQAEEEGREDSSVQASGDAGTGDDAEDIAAGGVILGAIHGR
jgi:hypothetical protein